jgi:hypothetical protein
MIQINRQPPAMPASAYQTYAIDTPADVFVRAACEDADCAAWRNGWETKVDETTDLGKQQAAYVRTQSRRTFREQRTAEGLTVFRFDSGQRCFAEHKTRPETYSVHRGDFRASSLDRVHTRAADWVEDFALHQDRIATQLNQG